MTDKKKKAQPKASPAKKKAAKKRKHPVMPPKVISSEEKSSKKIAALLDKVSDPAAKEKLMQVVIGARKYMPKDFSTAFKLLLHAAGDDNLERPDLYVKQLKFTVDLELRKAGDDKQLLTPLRQLRTRIEDMRIALAIPKAD